MVVTKYGKLLHERISLNEWMSIWDVTWILGLKLLRI